jgi:DNA polymerase I-like protein with 3'-5' exonuclease and polymerase domains
MNATLLSTTQEVSELLPRLMEKPCWGFDTETTGLNPLRSKVLMVQIGTQNEQYVIDTRKASIEPIRPFLESEFHKKIVHNAGFDWKMIKANFNIEMECVRDTFFAEKLLFNGKKFSGFSLPDVLFSYLNVEVSKDVRGVFGKGMIHGDYTEAMIAYAARDVEYLLPLAWEQARALERDTLQHVWLIECNAMPAFCEMELEGQYLDIPGWRQIMIENNENARLTEEAMDLLAAPFVQRNLFGELEVNYRSDKQVLELLQKMGLRARQQNKASGRWEDVLISDTGGKTLKKIIGDPFVDLLKKLRGLNTRISTFGQSFIDAVDMGTERLHPRFNQIGTETGRPSKASEGAVNMLNIPRDKRMRNCFRGDDSELVETDDFSGCELRIWAELSQDPKLCEAFRQGTDIHCYVASSMYNKPVTKKNENSHLRTPAKAINFGIAYGMGAYTLVEKLNGEGFPMELAEGKRLFKKYNDEFAVGVGYLRAMGTLARRWGWLANLSGRRRYWRLPDPSDKERFPKGREDPTYLGIMSGIEREGGNFMIQSVNADMTKMAMHGIRKLRKQRGFRTKFMNQVYDEIVTRTHKDDSAEFHPLKQKIMIEAAESLLKSVPMEVDGHVGPCWTK